MTTKHTPGPWELRSDVPYTSHGIVVFYGRGANRTICRLRHGTKEECEANARLIAAAPDMLSVLESLVRWAKKPREMIWEKAEAAIRKARGEDRQ